MPGLKRGLRLRVALAFAIFCIIVVGTLGISLYIASDDIEEAHIEQIMQTEMDYLLQRYRDNHNFIPQVGSKLEKYIIHDPSEESKLPPYLQGLNYRRHKVFRGPEEIRVAVRHVDGVKFLVAYEVGLHDLRQQELRLLIVLSLLSVVGVALVVGYLLAGVLVRQVTDLAERVRHLAPGDGQGATMIQPGQDEEVAQLAHALDDYQNRITRMLRREQEFTANVSHELRTPITTILTSCELLATEPNLPERARVRIGMIEGAATRMGEQLQALLFLAREQALGIMEPVALGRMCLRGSGTRMYGDISQAPKFRGRDRAESRSYAEPSGTAYRSRKSASQCGAVYRARFYSRQFQPEPSFDLRFWHWHRAILLCHSFTSVSSADRRKARVWVSVLLSLSGYAITTGGLLMWRALLEKVPLFTLHFLVLRLGPPVLRDLFKRAALLFGRFYFPLFSIYPPCIRVSRT